MFNAKEYNKEWRKAHPDYQKKWRAEKSKDPAYIETSRAKHNEWREKNKEDQNKKAMARYYRRSTNDCEKQKSYTRKWHLKNRYGITIEKFDEILHNQGGACAICGDSHWFGKSPQVDHSHKTGAVRGILCIRCNMVVGIIEKDSEFVSRVFSYINDFVQDDEKIDRDEGDRE